MKENQKLEPDFFRKKEIFEYLEKSDPRGRIILGSTIIDELLRRLLERRLVKDENVLKEAFDFNGMLDTFSSRIKMCYLLGEISKELYKELEALRKIRNMCAHRIKIITPDDPRIIEYEKKLRLVRDVFKGIEKNKQLSIFIMSIACYIVAIVKRITRTTPFEKRPYELNNLGFEEIDYKYMDNEL